MTDFKFLVPVLCASAMTIAPARESAADLSAGDDWQFNAGVYLWGAGIKGEAASGGDLDNLNLSGPMLGAKLRF